MKKPGLTLTLLLLLVGSTILQAQDEYPRGTPIGRIFAEYKYSVSQNDDYNGFNVTRAWLGYKYLVDENFTAQVILDIGSPLGTAELSSKRYSYLRNALIAYNKESFTITFGLTDARAAKTELGLWGKRYLSRPFLLNYKFVNIADLGIVIDYRISPKVALDAAILNGEGYTNIQMDDNLLYGLGITITPINGFTIRGYADTYKGDEGTQNTLAATTGYKHDKFTMAFGYNYKSDFDWTDKHNAYGFTTFGSFNFTPKFEIFGRYDKLMSNIPEGDDVAWNSTKDGSLIVAGLQYKFIRQIKAGLSYQGWSPESAAGSSWNFIRFDMEFRF